MSIEYMIPKNKPFSPWILSGKEAETLIKYLNSDPIEVEPSVMDRVRKTLSMDKARKALS